MNFVLYDDESLESTLLRLCNFLHYSKFIHFSNEMLVNRTAVANVVSGSIPTVLSKINLSYANSSSKKRVMAFWRLENELELKQLNLLKSSLMHSDIKFLNQITSIQRDGIHYPRLFLRKNTIPICPECLKEAEYIRQHWHFSPYSVCHRHGVDMIHACPNCGAGIDYCYEEMISTCPCGYDLRMSPTQKACDKKYQAVEWLVTEAPISGSLPDKMTSSHRNGFLLWYSQRYGDLDNVSYEDFYDYCQHWPNNLYQELDHCIQQYDYLGIRKWADSAFSDVFGELVINARHLPSRLMTQNIVLKAILDFLIKKFHQETLSGDKKVSLLQLSVLEAASLLSCTNEEIYRLYDFGFMPSQNRAKLHSKLSVHQASFRLEDILSLRLTRMASDTTELDYFLPSK